MKLVTIITTLFFLVACKSGLNNNTISALVQIENQTQQNSQAKLYEAKGNYYDFYENQVYQMKISGKLSSNISGLIERMQKVDSVTNCFLKEIDDLKLLLLKNAKENVRLGKENDPKSIVWNKSDLSSTESKLMCLNLDAIKDKSNTETVQKSNINNRLWHKYNVFIADLLEIVSSYTIYDNSYSFRPKMKYRAKSQIDLEKQFIAEIDASKANLISDREVVTAMFMSLYMNEETRLKQFTDVTILWAICNLSFLQSKISSAKNCAFTHIKLAVTFCGYPYNSFAPVVTGASNAKVGDEVELKVKLAFYDSYSEPILTVKDAKNSKICIPKDGNGIVKLKVGKGLQKIHGTITIKKKSGESAVRDWEWGIYGY